MPDLKKILRRQMSAKRATYLGQLSQQKLLVNLLEAVSVTQGDVVAAVWPLDGEVDLRPFCSQLLRVGRTVVLPETPRKGEALHFRKWNENSNMLQGRFGTQYPDGPIVRPDVVLVPFLAFDRLGYRLGYGGGYYDRTLAVLHNVTSIGYGFSFQEVKNIPIDEYDVALSKIVTEQEVIETQSYKRFIKKG